MAGLFILLGIHKMPDYGIKISKSNQDVGTSSVSQMILDSQYALFKLYSSGVGTLVYPGSGSGTTAQIAHNLGYTPFVSVYGQYVDENTGTVVNRYRVFSWMDTPGLHIWDQYTFHADGTNLYVGFSPSGNWTGTQNLIYQYNIFYDSGI